MPSIWPTARTASSSACLSSGPSASWRQRADCRRISRSSSSSPAQLHWRSTCSGAYFWAMGDLRRHVRLRNPGNQCAQYRRSFGGNCCGMVLHPDCGLLASHDQPRAAWAGTVGGRPKPLSSQIAGCFWNDVLLHHLSWRGRSLIAYGHFGAKALARLSRSALRILFGIDATDRG